MLSHLRRELGDRLQVRDMTQRHATPPPNEAHALQIQNIPEQTRDQLVASPPMHKSVDIACTKQIQGINKAARACHWRKAQKGIGERIFRDSHALFFAGYLQAGSSRSTPSMPRIGFKTSS